MSKRLVTLRRTLEQAKHCLEEALSVLDGNEDARCAHDDVLQASGLLQTALPQLSAMARGAERGYANLSDKEP